MTAKINIKLVRVLIIIIFLKTTRRYVPWCYCILSPFVLSFISTQVILLFKKYCSRGLLADNNLRKTAEPSVCSGPTSHKLLYSRFCFNLWSTCFVFQSEDTFSWWWPLHLCPTVGHQFLWTRPENTFWKLMSSYWFFIFNATMFSCFHLVSLAI